MEIKYHKKIDVLWSHIDSNFHVRHSVYYDWGATVGLSYLIENGMSPRILLRHGIGPVFLREECVFKQEIQFEDKIEFQSFFVKLKPDLSHWTLKHEIWKNSNTICAVITVDGAWINMRTRKFTTLPESFREGINVRDLLMEAG